MGRSPFSSPSTSRSPYIPPTPLYIPHPPAPSDANDPIRGYFTEDETIWNALGMDVPPPSPEEKVQEQLKYPDPFHREIYLVRPFWMEVKEMEEKISACKDVGISRELVDEMSMPIWGGPGLESMQGALDKIKEGLVACYYGRSSLKRKSKSDEEEDDPPAPKRVATYDSEDECMVGQMSTEESNESDSSECSQTRAYGHTLEEFETLKESFSRFIDAAYRCSVDQLEGDYSDVMIGDQIDLVSRESILQEMHCTCRMEHIMRYFGVGGLMEDLRLEPKDWIEHFGLEQKVCKTEEAIANHISMASNVTVDGYVSVRIGDGVGFTLE